MTRSIGYTTPLLAMFISGLADEKILAPFTVTTGCQQRMSIWYVKNKTKSWKVITFIVSRDHFQSRSIQRSQITILQVGHCDGSIYDVAQKDLFEICRICEKLRNGSFRQLLECIVGRGKQSERTAFFQLKASYVTPMIENTKRKYLFEDSLRYQQPAQLEQEWKTCPCCRFAAKCQR